MEIDFGKILNNENFGKFIDTNKKTKEEYLLVSKAKLCEYFCISRPTLLKWMRNNGYDDLIEKKKGKSKKELDLSVDL